MPADRLEMIEWRDAHAESEQTDPKDWRSDYIVRSVGWVMAEDGRWVHLVGERLPYDDGVRSTTHIPVACIVARHVLTNGRKNGAREGQGRAPGEEGAETLAHREARAEASQARAAEV